MPLSKDILIQLFEAWCRLVEADTGKDTSEREEFNRLLAITRDTPEYQQWIDRDIRRTRPDWDDYMRDQCRKYYRKKNPKTKPATRLQG